MSIFPSTFFSPLLTDSRVYFGIKSNNNIESFEISTQINIVTFRLGIWKSQITSQFQRDGCENENVLQDALDLS